MNAQDGAQIVWLGQSYVYPSFRTRAGAGVPQVSTGASKLLVFGRRRLVGSWSGAGLPVRHFVPEGAA